MRDDVVIQRDPDGSSVITDVSSDDLGVAPFHDHLGPAVGTGVFPMSARGVRRAPCVPLCGSDTWVRGHWSGSTSMAPDGRTGGFLAVPDDVTYVTSESVVWTGMQGGYTDSVQPHQHTEGRPAPGPLPGRTHTMINKAVAAITDVLGRTSVQGEIVVERDYGQEPTFTPEEADMVVTLSQRITLGMAPAQRVSKVEQAMVQELSLEGIRAMAARNPRRLARLAMAGDRDAVDQLVEYGDWNWRRQAARAA